MLDPELTTEGLVAGQPRLFDWGIQSTFFLIEAVPREVDVKQMTLNISRLNH
jgi:hypothetical protein